MTTQTMHQELNGVNVTALMETLEAIKANPALAKARFRATSRWMDGAHNRAMVQNYTLGGEDPGDRMEPFVHDFDEPIAMLGTDSGANPVEFILTALSGCLTTSMVLNAAARGIKINSIRSTYEGELDLRGLFQLDETVRNGYSSIQVTFEVDADAPRETIEELVESAQQCSPVFDMVTNGVPVTVTFKEA